MKSLYFIIYDMSEMGGIQGVIVKMANALADRGYDVHIVSMVLRETIPWHLSPQVEVHNINRSDDSYNRALITGFPELRSFFRGRKADVVFLMGHYAIKYILCPRYTKARLIFCDHGALANQLDNRRVTMLRYLSTRFADHIVTLTERTLRDYREKWHIPADRIECIPNWMEEPEEQPQPYDIRSRKIVTVGRFTPEKGFDRVVRIAEKVFHRHPDWEWHAIGDGECREEIQQEAQRRGIGNQLLFPGRVNDMPQRYPHYAMYVLPSYREGLPLVLLEAKQHHLPMVSFDCLTGPSEIITDGKDGLLIPNGDEEAMAQAVCRLIESEETRQAMAEYQGDKIGRFRREAVLEQWIRLIEKC